MFIIFDRTTGKIHSYGYGSPTVSGNKLHIGAEVICNDLALAGWKTITDQNLEMDDIGEFGRLADYYPEDTTPTIQDQINTLAYLMGVS